MCVCVTAQRKHAFYVCICGKYGPPLAENRCVCHNDANRYILLRLFEMAHLVFRGKLPEGTKMCVKWHIEGSRSIAMTKDVDVYLFAL